MGHTEAVEKLFKVFVKQPPEVIAKMAASIAIDLCKMIDIHNITEEESKCLVARVLLNCEQFKIFLRSDEEEGNVILQAHKH